MNAQFAPIVQPTIADGLTAPPALAARCRLAVGRTRGVLKYDVILGQRTTYRKCYYSASSYSYSCSFSFSKVFVEYEEEYEYEYEQEIDTRGNRGATLRAGAEAPNFRLRLDDGRFITLHDLRGRPVLINFGASWCGPYRLETPDIVAQAQADPDLVVLAVNVQETMARVQPFVEDFHMTMPVALDANAELRNLYQLRGMPSSVFIDRTGNISTIWTGILDGALLQQLIDDIR
ncbi:MAG: hypothetical protein DCC55_07495 [Chloroflexi bacterium]|nr:MAG: hypothetical protein DCC55_07495 [Chloroflexota bacterium]